MIHSVKNYGPHAQKESLELIVV